MKKSILSKWKKEDAWAGEVVDGLGKPIDAGIRETVVVLRVLGFYTIGSCEGHENWGVGGPWAHIGFKQHDEIINRIRVLRDRKQTKKVGAEIDELARISRRANLRIRVKLLKLLDAFYQTRHSSVDTMLVIEGYALGSNRLENQGVETLTVLPRAERMGKLLEYKKEMQEFTKFLKKQIGI